MIEKKVCIMTSVHPVFDTRIFYKQCRSLAEKGFEVILIAKHHRKEVVEGVRIIPFSEFRNRFLRIFFSFVKMFFLAIRQKTHVYHFHDPELIPVGLLLRILGKKVIYDVHEDYPLDIQSRYWLPLWMRIPVSWLLKQFETFSARFFNYIVSATPAIAERFKLINTNTVIVHNFSKLDELTTTEKRIPWRNRLDAVIYIGGIDISLGIKEMVKAIDLVQKKLYSQLILAGEFSPKSLKKEIQNLPGWKNVEYRGFLSRNKLADLLNQIKAGLVLRHPVPHYLVSYPTKLFEYMSVGIPVIAADFPLWRKIVVNAGCGLLVDPLDPQAIADSILYILEHPEEAEEMGKNGREAVEEKYNWSREEKKLLGLYMDLLK